ncbi:MAG: tetratricopeptide repeat protein [Saprospiraceae bacterium]
MYKGLTILSIEIKANICLQAIGLLMALSWFGTELSAQTKHQLLREADQFYYSDNFKSAEENYRKALESEKEADATYNLGNTIYKQNRIDEAIEKYESAASSANNEDLKSKAYHNLGNAYFQKKEYDKSIDAFQKSLLINPKDLETKKNLALAKQQLVQQQQQQQQNQDENKKNEQQNQQQQQQNKDQENQENQNQQDQQQQSEQQQNEKQKETPKDLTKREAEKLLDIMNQEEQKVQEKIQKGNRKEVPNGKDW